MRPFNRLRAPDFLKDNWEAWSNEYATRKTTDPSYTFQWKKYQRQPLNQRLLPDLREQTQHHCSYCDAYPPNLPDKTIDHFRPKGDARFYHLAYHWENLYFACGHCQKAKMEQFNDELLRPDEDGFSFERYFIFNFSTGEIEINPAASDEEKRRAAITIRLFGFNLEGQPFSRQRELQCVFDDLDQHAFRFLFD